MAKRKINDIVNVNPSSKRKTEHNILSGDDTFKFDFMTSLGNIAKAKIVSNMWMSKKYQEQILDLFHSHRNPGAAIDKWEQIIDNVISGISALPLPNSIVQELTKIAPILGSSIFNWITYHDLVIFQTIEDTEYAAVDFLNSIKWTARGKLDYKGTAKNILNNHENCLIDVHKYILACNYCLEDEIAIISPKVVGPNFLDKLSVEGHPMVYFWTCRITGHQRRSSNIYLSRRAFRTMSYNEYIFHLTFKTDKAAIHNVVPIIYMWNKLSEEEKSRNVKSLFRELTDQDFRIFLLSNLSYYQQQRVFKKYYDCILDEMFNDWLWGGYFLPTALYVLNIMRPSYYLDILNLIICEIQDSLLENVVVYKNIFIHKEYKEILRQLWQNAPVHLKKFVFDHTDGVWLLKFGTFLLPWDPDFDIFKLILNEQDKDQNKLIMESSRIAIFAEFIKDAKWDLLEVFVKEIIPSEDDLERLKQMLIVQEGINIAVKFIKEKAWDNLECLMNWAFKSDDEKTHFKEELTFSLFGGLQSTVFHNMSDYVELEKRLNWFSLINSITYKSSTTYYGYVVEELIMNDKYEMIDQILNWCFSNDNRKVAQFKRKMYKDDNLQGHSRYLVVNLALQTNDFSRLDKFENWAFSSL